MKAAPTRRCAMATPLPLFMPGTFSVIGTIPLPGRGLVAYGDIATGSVAAGEILVIPLNRNIAMSAVIKSVEAVDGTPTGSHVALLLGEDDLEIKVLEALGLRGETLAVRSAEAESAVESDDGMN